MSKTFNKTTGTMSKEICDRKFNKIWKILKSGEGFVQRREEIFKGVSKWYLIIRAIEERRNEVEEILKNG